MATKGLISEYVRRKEALIKTLGKIAITVTSSTSSEQDKKAIAILYSSLRGDRDISFIILDAIALNDKLSEDDKKSFRDTASYMGLLTK